MVFKWKKKRVSRKQKQRLVKWIIYKWPLLAEKKKNYNQMVSYLLQALYLKKLQPRTSKSSEEPFIILFNNSRDHCFLSHHKLGYSDISKNIHFLPIKIIKWSETVLWTICVCASSGHEWGYQCVNMCNYPAGISIINIRVGGWSEQLFWLVPA